MAIGIIGYSGTTRLDGTSQAMQRVSDLNAVALEVDRDVQELQMRAAKYVISGHDSMRDSVLDLHAKLVLLVNSSITNQSDPEMLSVFRKISDHLPEYRTQFDSAIEERQIRTSLVQQQLPTLSDSIGRRLGELEQIAFQEKQSPKARNALLLCKTALSRAEQRLLRYYVAPDSTLVDGALEDIDSALTHLQTLQEYEPTKQLCAQVLVDIREFERIGMRAVQATRGYLFLVNVVMAGEAAEISYYSDRLRRMSESRRSAIASTVQSTVDGVRQLTGYGIGTSLLLAVFIAARLVMLILPPIQSLTSTFQRLASGETVVAIPEVERNDEIGEMARAARVFSDQNRQQVQLLATSEELGRQLTANAENLEKTNADLNSFAYVASHDLKSPLRAIRQLASWIEEDSGHLLPADSLKHFQTIEARVHRMEMLLNDLLQYARVGTTESEAERVNSATLVEDLVGLCDNPLRVQIIVSGSLPIFVTIRTPLEQVFRNLISNAIKYNDKGDRGIVQISCENVDDSFVFKVKDNGPGISPQHHERVFQMYQRVGDTNTEGTGMGLAIVKKQVEKHGGRISVESNADAGVTFSFSWPESFAERVAET